MPSKQRKPTLTVIAGPNGAGKTRLSNFLQKAGLFDCNPVNIDLLISEIDTRSISSDFLRYESQVKKQVNKLFRERCKKAIAENKNFAYESNLATQIQLDVIAMFDDAGYMLNLIYISISNVDKCLERVQKRVSEGGHYVSDEDIHHNFSQGLRNLDNSFKDWYKVYFIDNTPEIAGTSETLNVLFFLKEGKVKLFIKPPFPNVQKYLPKLMETLGS